MYAAIAIVLFALWALGFYAFHVATGFVHLLLVLALLSIVMQFIIGWKPWDI